MSAMASQITDITIVYSTVHSGADQRKHQSSELLAFLWGIHRWPVNSPHKGPVTRKVFPFDDVIMSPLTSGTYQQEAGSSIQLRYSPFRIHGPIRPGISQIRNYTWIILTGRYFRFCGKYKCIWLIHYFYQILVLRSISIHFLDYFISNKSSEKM